MSLRNKKLDDILAEARPRIGEFWAGCMKAGLPGYTPATIASLLEFVDAYFEDLKALPDEAPSAAILLRIEHFFRKVDKLVASVGCQFLETDDREILVPVITEAASATGLDIETFEGADPTLKFRSF